MKPPYVRITAECSNHGKFTVERKPNKNSGTAGSGCSIAPGFYQAVKCPHCPWWAKILDQKLIEQTAAPAAGQNGFEF